MCSTYGGEQRCIQCCWLGNLRERPLGRSRRRWEDNIKMDLQEVDFEGMEWIVMAQDRDRWRVPVNVVMNLLVP